MIVRDIKVKMLLGAALGIVARLGLIQDTDASHPKGPDHDHIGSINSYEPEDFCVWVDVRHVPAGAPLFDTDEGAEGGLALDPLDAVKLAVVLPEAHGPGVAGETGYEMVRATRWFAELVSARKANGGVP